MEVEEGPTIGRVWGKRSGACPPPVVGRVLGREWEDRGGPNHWPSVGWGARSRCGDQHGGGPPFPPPLRASAWHFCFHLACFAAFIQHVNCGRGGGGAKGRQAGPLCVLVRPPPHWR